MTSAKSKATHKKFDRAPAHPDPMKWTRTQKLQLIARMEAEEAAERCRELESRGWEAWYSEIFGEDFVKVLAPHHREAVAWHWNNLMLRRAGQNITKYAYFAIWPRGHMKSTLARRIAVCDAALSGVGYCLYTSGTKSKVRSHAISIETLLASAKVKEYYPRLSTVKRNEQGGSKGWQADFIYTDAGYVFHFISLDEGVAGANVDNVRPTLIVPDDVDDRQLSALISENRLRVLTRAILPTRQKGTLVLWAQNLISRHSVLYQIYTGRQRVLTNRVQTKPIPAFIDLRTEERLIDGIVHDIIIGGTPTWDYFDRELAQETLDTIGLESFLAECQQEVEQDKSGLILPEYDDARHPITWDEFNTLYNLPEDNREIPRHWRRYVGFDWGSSGAEAGHACVVLFFAVASANSPLASTVYLFKSMTFPASVIAGTVAHAVLNFVLWDLQSDERTRLEFSLLDRSVADPSDALAARVRDRVINELSRREQWAMFHMSHEARAVRDIHRMVYGLNWVACNPKRDGGVEQMRHYLRMDYSEPHPFIHGEMGRGRMYLIVSDGEQRRVARDDDGHKLVRYQWSEWRRRPTQLTAKGFLDDRPLKMDDDCGNAAMMVFTHFNLRATPLTSAEEFESRIPVESRYSTLLAESPFEKGLTASQELQLIMARANARKNAPSQLERWDEFGNRL